MTTFMPPLCVARHQRLSWTEVVIRDARPSWRALATIHDGPYNMEAVASLFAASLDLQVALRELAAHAAELRGAMVKLMTHAGIGQELQTEILQRLDVSLVRSTDALLKSQTPAPDTPGVESSDPTYEQLVTAIDEIRRIVGDGSDEAVDRMSDDELEEIPSQVAHILDGLRPRAMQASLDASNHEHNAAALSGQTLAPEGASETNNAQ